MSLDKANSYLEKYVKRGEGLNIVQIGCNNCEDHVSKFVQKNSNNINNFIAVDALSSCTKIAEEKYKFLGEKFHAINVAIGINNGLIDFFCPLDGEKSYLASANRKQLSLMRDTDIQKKMIPCLNINTFLRHLPFKRVDRFYVDAEGLDASILLEMNFEECSPSFIQFERVHSDGHFITNLKLEKLVQKFKEYDYKTSLVRMDMIAEKKSHL